MARMTERAQSLLVGAVFMAVIFVSLALLLNSSLYGTTIASDASADVTGGDGAVLRDAIRDDVGYLIEDANTRPISDRDDHVSNIVDNDLSPRYRDYYAQYDRIVDIRLPTTDVESGTRISSGSGTFNTDTTAGAGIADGVRFRRFTVDPNNFNGDGFTIRFDDSDPVTPVWDVNIKDGDGNGRVEVKVTHGASTASCEASSPGATIDISNASIGGKHCNALDFFERTEPPYTITFQNPGDIEGSYQLIVDDSLSVNSGGSASTVVYSTTVDLWERTPENKYNAQIRVAPGEPR